MRIPGVVHDLERGHVAHDLRTIAPGQVERRRVSIPVDRGSPQFLRPLQKVERRSLLRLVLFDIFPSDDPNAVVRGAIRGWVLSIRQWTRPEVVDIEQGPRHPERVTDVPAEQG